MDQRYWTRRILGQYRILAIDSPGRRLLTVNSVSLSFDYKDFDYMYKPWMPLVQAMLLWHDRIWALNFGSIFSNQSRINLRLVTSRSTIEK